MRHFKQLLEQYGEGIESDEDWEYDDETEESNEVSDAPDDDDEEIEYYIEDPEDEEEDEEEEEEQDEDEYGEYDEEVDSIKMNVKSKYMDGVIKKDPIESNQQKKEVKKEEKKEEFIERIPINILVGNTHIQQRNPQAMINGPLAKKCMSGDHRFILYVYLEDEKKTLTDRVVKSVEYRLKDDCKYSKVLVEKQPFILSRLATHSFPVEIFITFKKWTKLENMKINHTLCFEGKGEVGTKEYSIGLPRETYLENMLKQIQTGFYERNIEDLKKDRLYFEIGIDAQEAPKFHL